MRGISPGAGAEGTPALPLLQQAVLPVQPAPTATPGVTATEKTFNRALQKLPEPPKHLHPGKLQHCHSPQSGCSNGANSLTNTIKPQGETKKYKEEKRGLMLLLILRLFLPTAGSRSHAGAGLGQHITELRVSLRTSPLDRFSLDRKRQNSWSPLHFRPLLQSKKKTAIPTDMEIKSFLTHFTWVK